MTIREYIAELWSDLTGRQKLIVGLTVFIVVSLAFAGWFDSFRSNLLVKKYEREAERAKQDAANALKRAAEISTEIKRREEALTKVEGKRDAKELEVNEAGQATNSARADYERAVRDSRHDAPSTDELCAELAALGYPCE